LPGVGLWGRATWTREDLVESLQRFWRHRNVERPQGFVKLLRRARPNNRCSHHRVCQQPCQCHLRWLLSQLGTEALICFQLRTVLLDGFLRLGAGTAALLCLAPCAAKESTPWRTPWDHSKPIRLTRGQYLKFNSTSSEVVEALP